jgi:pimeloyl-ACP methyl ester carboxylesterase
LLLPFLALLTLACGIVFKSTTVINDDQSSTTRITVGIPKDFLAADPQIAQRWEQIKRNVRAYAEQNGGVVSEYDEGTTSGLDLDFGFTDFETINETLSSPGTGLFRNFELRRWRGVVTFEASTTSALLQERILVITGLTPEELFFVNFPLEIRLFLPGQLIESNATSILENSEQVWSINWLVDEQHLFSAKSRVPLYPVVITSPSYGERITDPTRRTTFTGTGEPGADLRLYRIYADGTRTLIGSGVIDQEGQWELVSVELGDPGVYVFQAEEITEYETQTSGQEPKVEVRPRSPIIFVPGYYACAEGVLHFDVQWQQSGSELLPQQMASLLFSPDQLQSTGLLPGVITEYYAPLFSYFVKQGYQLNKDFYVACYNWSDDLPAEANKFGEVLDDVILHNQSKMPITVITHSNGALVARYWIQKHPSETASVIRDVIMLAPPNHGVLDSYRPWEGGELDYLDNFLIRILVQISLFTKCSILPPISLQEPITEEMKLLYQKLVYKCVRYGEAFGPDEFILRTKLDHEITSLAWLLPTCPDGLPCELLNYTDAPVARLNTPDEIRAMANGISGRWHVLAGNHGPTEANFDMLQPASNEYPLWDQGKPDRINQTLAGDTTVTNLSSKLPELQRYAPEKYEEEIFIEETEFEDWIHSEGMVQEERLLERIGSVLSETVATREYVLANPNVMIIVVLSPVDLMVTDSNGLQAGVDPNKGLVLDIPGAYYGSSSDPLGPKVIIIPQPQAGEYTFAITGIADGEFEILAVSSAQAEPLVADQGSIQAGESKTYQSDYTPTDSTSPGSPPNRSVGPMILCGIGGFAVLLILIGIFYTRARKRAQLQSADYDPYALYEPRPKRGWFKKRSRDQSDDWFSQ